MALAASRISRELKINFSKKSLTNYNEKGDFFF
jgi:hypothetical protein